MSYLVIDTEGNPDLKEIALIDSSGQVIYHAHSQEYAPDHPQPKPLAQIVADLQRLAQNKLLIFHYADHDLKILQRAFQKARQPWLSNPTFCTWLAAKQYFPNLASYSLEHLSQHLGIQLASGYFNPNIAHDASYDALFTYHLYRHLIHAQLKAQNLPNPFANSKVDHPFQHYPDDTTTYHPQYQQLTAALQDIQQDANHQSRGVILLGEPGSGKTHLIMRVAQNLLRHNRLLFIPQPTHPDNIYHHIYSHTLESLREYVDDHHHTQLDYLIAKSFVEILKTLPQTQKIKTFSPPSLPTPSICFTAWEQRVRTVAVTNGNSSKNKFCAGGRSVTFSRVLRKASSKASSSIAVTPTRTAVNRSSAGSVAMT
jgi:DNA polymerase III epsilon subunit-like protein